MKFTRSKQIFWVLFLILSLVLTGCNSKPPAKPNVSTPAPAAPVTPSPSKPAESIKTARDQDVLAQALKKGQQINEMSYNIVIIGTGVSSESTVWLKDQKLKTDTTMNGQRIISIFDLSSGEVLSFMPDMPEPKTAAKMKFEEYQGLDNITPIDFLSELSQDKLILAGSDTINGTECQVALLTQGDNQVKLWVSLKDGIVLRIEDKMNNAVTNIEFRNMKLGSGTVPDNTFSLPAGIQIVDLNQMMQSSFPMGNP